MLCVLAIGGLVFSRPSRLINFFLIIAFVTSMVITPRVSYAQTVPGLPEPGTMMNLSSSYVPLMLTGLTIHPENPLLMDFIVSTGNSGLDKTEVKVQSDRLIKYFLACLTIPENNQWVNLSPYEKQRIIPDDLGQTVLGQDMLAQDYILKQLTASLIYPEKNLGKSFWDKVYAQASAQYGTTRIPVNTFNKVWILPEYAKVFTHKNTVFVVKSHLKVMLDEDYLAMQKHVSGSVIASEAKQSQVNNLGSSIVRQVILPAIEKEVNQGQNFAQMRQIYNSMILAVWFKSHLKQALLNEVYSDKSKTNGVNADDPAIKEKIYEQYIKAYKKGVFNFIKNDVDQSSQQVIPRKYFSGGLRTESPAMIHETDFNEFADAAQATPGDVYLEKGMTQLNSGTGQLASRAMTTVTAGNVHAVIDRLMSLPDTQRVVLMLDGPFEELNQVALAILKSGKKNIFVFNGPRFTASQLYRGKVGEKDGSTPPRLIQADPRELAEAGIELPAEGFIDGSKLDINSDYGKKVMAFLEAKAASNPNNQILASFEDQKFQVIGDDNKKVKVDFKGQTYNAYKNLHPYKLKIEINGNVYDVPLFDPITFEGYPTIIPNTATILGFSDDNIEFWQELLKGVDPQNILVVKTPDSNVFDGLAPEGSLVASTLDAPVMDALKSQDLVKWHPSAAMTAGPLEFITEGFPGVSITPVEDGIKFSRNGRVVLLTVLEAQGIGPVFKFGNTTYFVKDPSKPIFLKGINLLGNQVVLDFLGEEITGLKPQTFHFALPLDRPELQHQTEPLATNAILQSDLRAKAPDDIDVNIARNFVRANFQLSGPAGVYQLLHYATILGLNGDSQDYDLVQQLLNKLAADEQFKDQHQLIVSLGDYLQLSLPGVDWKRWKQESYKIRSQHQASNGSVRTKTLFEVGIGTTRLSVPDPENWGITGIKVRTDADVDPLADNNDPSVSEAKAAIEDGQVPSEIFEGGSAVSTKKVIGEGGHKMVHPALQVVTNLGRTIWISLNQARIGLLLGQSSKSRMFIVTNIGGTKEGESYRSVQRDLRLNYGPQLKSGQIKVDLQRSGLVLDKDGYAMHFKDGHVAVLAENHLWALMSLFLHKEQVMDVLKNTLGIISVGNGDNPFNYLRAGMIQPILDARNTDSPIATVALTTPIPGFRKGGITVDVTYTNKEDPTKTITQTEFREISEFATRNKADTKYDAIDFSKVQESTNQADKDLYAKFNEKGWFIEDLFADKKVAVNVAYYAMDARLFIARMFGLNEHDPNLIQELDRIDNKAWVDTLLSFANKVASKDFPDKKVPDEDGSEANSVTGNVFQTDVQNLIVNGMGLLAKEGLPTPRADVLISPPGSMIGYKGASSPFLDRNGNVIPELGEGYDLIANQEYYAGLIEGLLEQGHPLVLGEGEHVTRVIPATSVEEIREATRQKHVAAASAAMASEESRKKVERFLSNILPGNAYKLIASSDGDKVYIRQEDADILPGRDVIQNHLAELASDFPGYIVSEEHPAVDQDKPEVERLAQENYAKRVMIIDIAPSAAMTVRELLSRIAQYKNGEMPKTVLITINGMPISEEDLLHLDGDIDLSDVDIQELGHIVRIYITIKQLVPGRGELVGAASPAMTAEEVALNRLESIKQLYQNIGLTLTPRELLDLISPELEAHHIGFDKVSFFVNKDGLVIVGPVNEKAPQYFRFILTRPQVELVAHLQQARDVQVIEQDLGPYHACNIEIPSSNLPAKREVLRLVMDGLVQGPAVEIVPGLVSKTPGLALTPAMERQVFVANAEKQFLADYEKSAQQASDDYPELNAFWQDIKAGRPARLVLTRELIEKWNVQDLVKNLKDLARKALAGMRATQNPLNPTDLTKVMNILLTLLTSNELAEMALEQARIDHNQNPQALIAGEVRYNTPDINMMLVRRLAAMGLTVHTPRPGDFLPIGAASFVTTTNDILMTLYGTSSHAARMIFAYKMMGFLPMHLSEFEREALEYLDEDPSTFERATSEGAQLLVDQMVRLADGVAAKIQHVVDTGEPLVLDLADVNDSHIKYDIDNPDSPENIDVSKEYADDLQASYLSGGVVSEITQALGSGMRIGYSQGNGASYGFNQRVFNHLLGNKATAEINWSNIYPDSFFDGTGMGNYNPKAVKAQEIADFVSQHRDGIDRYYSDKPVGFSLTGKMPDGKTVYFQVYPATAEAPILRAQQIPYIKLSNNNLLAYYEPNLFDGSQDVSLLEVVINSGLPSAMIDKPVGYIESTTDPDGDRFVVMQVEKNDPATIARLKRLNVAFLRLSDDKLLAVYVPNQDFFDIQGSLIDTLKARGEFRQDSPDFDEYNEITFFAISTTVSTNLWRDLWNKNKVPTVLIPVGFKEISRMEQIVEEQVRINELRVKLGLRKKRVIVHDVFGNAVDLGFNPRLLFAGEESGGMVPGKKVLIKSKDGTRSFIAWREKSAVEAFALFLKKSAEIFNKARETYGAGLSDDELYQNPQFLEAISLSHQLGGMIEEQGSVNTAELRADATLVDLMALAKMNKDDAKAYQAQANARRDANDAFWVSLAFAYGDGVLNLEQVKRIIKDALKNDNDVMSIIEQKTAESAPTIRDQIDRWFDEELIDVLFQGDGVYLKFKSGGYAVNRPSGTDPKIKGYPSTDSPFLSAVLGNGLSNLDPTKKVPQLWSELLQDHPELLDVNQVLARKEVQYERGLKVDSQVVWQGQWDLKDMMNADEREVLRAKGIKSSDIMIVLGPRRQAVPLLYAPHAGRIYVSWSFDDQMNALWQDGQTATLQGEFATALSSVVVDGDYGTSNAAMASLPSAETQNFVEPRVLIQDLQSKLQLNFLEVDLSKLKHVDVYDNGEPRGTIDQLRNAGEISTHIVSRLGRQNPKDEVKYKIVVEPESGHAVVYFEDAAMTAETLTKIEEFATQGYVEMATSSELAGLKGELEGLAEGDDYSFQLRTKSAMDEDNGYGKYIRRFVRITRNADGFSVVLEDQQWEETTEEHSWEDRQIEGSTRSVERTEISDKAAVAIPTLTAENGGIDLNSRSLKMQSEGDKVNITFSPAMIAQFRRGDFSGVRIQIFDVVQINLMSLVEN